jgi:type I site-specific restriction-modification system R (restriction) subunit
MKIRYIIMNINFETPLDGNYYWRTYAIIDTIGDKFDTEYEAIKRVEELLQEHRDEQYIIVKVYGADS